MRLYCSQQEGKNGGIMEHYRDYSEWRPALRGATQLIGKISLTRRSAAGGTAMKVSFTDFSRTKGKPLPEERAK